MVTSGTFGHFSPLRWEGNKWPNSPEWNIIKSSFTTFQWTGFASVTSKLFSAFFKNGIFLFTSYKHWQVQSMTFGCSLGLHPTWPFSLLLLTHFCCRYWISVIVIDLWSGTDGDCVSLAVTQSHIWALDRQTFQTIMMRSIQARHEEYLNFLRRGQRGVHYSWGWGRKHFLHHSWRRGIP